MVFTDQVGENNRLDTEQEKTGTPADTDQTDTPNNGSEQKEETLETNPSDSKEDGESKEDGSSSETNPGEADTDETNPDGTDTDGTNPDGTDTDETNPDGTDTDETNPDGTDADETNPDGTDTDETNPDGTDADEINPEDKDTSEENEDNAGAGKSSAAQLLAASESDFTYEVDGTNAVVTGYTGSEAALVIPEKLGENTVTAIGKEAFKKNESLTGVTLPDSVTAIGSSAFSGCTNLASVTLSKNLTSIEARGFENCSSLKEIEIPKSLTSAHSLAVFGGSGVEKVTFEEGTTKIADYILKESRNLKTVLLPETVTEIGNSAFISCTGLETITFPDGVTVIGGAAFKGCTALASVNLPKNLTSIGPRGFEECGALKEIEIPKTLTSANSLAVFGGSGIEKVTFEDGTTKVANYLLRQSSNLKTVILPETVTEIGDSAFLECTGLETITLPDSVTVIGASAFNGCVVLASVNLPGSLTNIGARAFEGCSALKEIEIPKGLTSAPDLAAFKGSSIEKVIFEEGTTKIADNILKEITSLKTVILPETVTEIGSSVFMGCTGIEMITLPDSVTAIGGSVFHGCTNLSSVTLSKSLTSIGTRAFENCSALTEIEIPKSLTSAPDLAAFKGSSIEKVTFEQGTTRIADNLLKEITSLKTVLLPETVTEIGNNAFMSCTGLEMITLPDSVAKIGSFTFYDCTSLSSVRLPKSLLNIGKSGFGNCSALKEIEIPKNLSEVNGGAFIGSGLATAVFEEGITKVIDGLFSGCGSLQSVTIPDTVTVIGELSFGSCSALTAVEIPASVTTIGNRAFMQCTGLTGIVLPDSITGIGDSAFANCTSLAQLTLSKRVTQIEKDAFLNCISLTQVEIPKSLLSASGIFAGCSGLKTITFEEGTEMIREGLLMNCGGLEEIIIPDTVMAIGNYAFSGCTNLSKIDIPDSVVTIGEYAMSSCSGLSAIEIPGSVTTIGSYAFYGCSALVSAEMADGVTTLGEYVFSGCTALPSFVMPDSVTTLGIRVFDGCSKLSSVTLSQNLDTIEAGTFRRSGLTAVTVPASVHWIRQDAFEECIELAEVNLPEELNAIGGYAFRNCKKLSRIVIPESVTSLGSYAFEACDLLSEVTLSSGISQILPYTFNSCVALTEIILPYRVETIDSRAFTNCIALVDITIPRSTTQISDDAFSYDYLNKLTIRGVRGTYAEEFANNRQVTFVPIDIPATEVKLNKTELTLMKGESQDLFLSVKPINFTDEVVWRSLNEDVVWVSDKGGVSAIGAGATQIKVTVGETEVFCDVTVIQTVERVILSEGRLKLEALETFTLTAEVLPEDAFNKDITWSSENDEVATVDQNGKVTARGRGETIIRATAQDGSGQTGGCSVEVLNNCYFCTSVEEMESPHDYLPDCSDFWIYTEEGADELEITFDENTKVEEGYDYIHIYDGSNRRIGKYTGTQLAGKTIGVPGDTVKIRLITDGRGNMWGFKVTSISNPESVLESDVPENGIPEGMWIAGIEKDGYAYTGKAVKPNIRVYDGNRRLRAGTDYTVAYKNNVKANDGSVAGTAPTVTIKGKGNYTKNGQVTFKINKVDLMDESLVTAEDITLAPNNKVQKKAPVVIFGGKKLNKGKDYNIEYTNTENGAYKDVGSYDIKLTGIGNFTGSRTIKINITDKTLIEKAKVAKIPNKPYDNVKNEENYRVILSESDLVVYMKSKNSPLKMGVDYDVAYENNDKAGTAVAVITGKGSCIGTKRVTFKITGISMSKVSVSGLRIVRDYNGNEWRPNLYVSYNGERLTEDKDYIVAYHNNEDAGTAQVVVTGIGKYTGTVKNSFKILPCQLKDSMIVGFGSSLKVKYVKGGCKPKLTLVLKDTDGKIVQQLVEGIDYTLSYSNNANVADETADKAPMIKIKGKGNYKGTLTKKFTIETKALNDSGAPVELTIADVGYASGKGKYISKPVLTDADGKVMKVNTDYTVEYRLGSADGTLLNNQSTVEADSEVYVTVTGKGKYSGTLQAKYRVAQYNFTKASITVEPQIFTGKPVKLSAKDVHVKMGKTEPELNWGTDFEIVEDSYVNNVKKGTASVKIRGCGIYGGTKTVKFKINTRNIEF